MTEGRRVFVEWENQIFSLRLELITTSNLRFTAAMLIGQFQEKELFSPPKKKNRQGSLKPSAVLKRL
jgi:hypothetical protein